MEILLLNSTKNTQTRFIEIHYKLSKEAILPTFNASKGRFKDFFELFIQRIYERSGVEYIDILRAIKNIHEANAYVVSYLDDLLTVNLNLFKTEDKIESFNEIYVSEFINNFIKVVKLAKPSFIDEDEDDPFKAPITQNTDEELIDLTSITVDEELLFSQESTDDSFTLPPEEDEEIYKPKKYPLNLTGLTGVFTDEQLNKAVNEFLESREKFKDSLEVSNMYNQKIKNLQREVKIKQELKKLEYLSNELEILSLEISQILITHKNKKRP